MAFRVGQKVVCVDASRGQNTGHKHLIKGQVYIVDGIDPETETGIYLIGVPKIMVAPWKTPVGWRQDRFRPVIEKSTDTGMAIFREILDRETDKPPVKAKPITIRD